MATITSVVPSTGTAGDTITINGTGFTGVSNVTLGGASVSYVFVSDIKITFTVPSEAGGTYDLALVFDATLADTGAFTVTESLLPTLLSIVPESAPPGTPIELIGTNFGLVNTVHVGSASLSYGGSVNNSVAGEFYAISDTVIQFLMPHLSDALYDITFDYEFGVTYPASLTVT